MRTHGGPADVEPVGDSSRVLAGGDQAEDIELPRSQPLPVPWLLRRRGAEDADGYLVCRDTPQVAELTVPSKSRVAGRLKASLHQGRDAAVGTRESFGLSEGAHDLPARSADVVAEHEPGRSVLSKDRAVFPDHGDGGALVGEVDVGEVLRADHPLIISTHHASTSQDNRGNSFWHLPLRPAFRVG